MLETPNLSPKNLIFASNGGAWYSHTKAHHSFMTDLMRFFLQLETLDHVSLILTLKKEFLRISRLRKEQY